MTSCAKRCSSASPRARCATCTCAPALDLQTQTPHRVFDLAYHFDAAGESERALPFALAAAGQARAQHSLEVAEQQYRIAERGAVSADQTTRYRIAEGLGDVLMLRGRYDEAAQKTEAARELAEGDLAKARIEGKLGELAFKRGDMKTAMEAIERSLDRLGRRVPQWSGSFVVQLLREVSVQALHTIFPRLFVNRRTLENVEEELLLVRLHNRLTYAYWFKRGQIHCLWTHLRGMNLAEHYPPTLELAQAYSIDAAVMSLLPYISRGIDYAEKSLAIRKALGDVWGQGQSLHFHGIVLYVASRFEEAIEKLREAIRLLERTGDYWEVNIARYHTCRSLFRLGRLQEAIALARRIHQSGLELGDVQALGVCLDIWVQATGAQVAYEDAANRAATAARGRAGQRPARGGGGRASDGARALRGGSRRLRKGASACREGRAEERICVAAAFLACVGITSSGREDIPLESAAPRRVAPTAPARSREKRCRWPARSRTTCRTHCACWA